MSDKDDVKPDTKSAEPDTKANAKDDASDAKAKESTRVERRLSGTVSANPDVRRGDDGSVTSIRFPMKASFKGEVTIKARGDVASAYWSLTRGMNINVRGVETGEKEYQAEAIDLLPATKER